MLKRWRQNNRYTATVYHLVPQIHLLMLLLLVLNPSFLNSRFVVLNKSQIYILIALFQLKSPRTKTPLLLNFSHIQILIKHFSEVKWTKHRFNLTCAFSSEFSSIWISRSFLEEEEAVVRVSFKVNIAL